MRVYQAADGRWILWTGAVKVYYDTEEEARAEMQIQEEKLARATAIRAWATTLASVDDFLAVVNAREFGHSQTNEPTDDDLVTLGISQTDYRNGLAMLLALYSFLDGTAVVGDIVDRRDVIAKLRTDV